jgi:selenocysteine-specific elongation factor
VVFASFVVPKSSVITRHFIVATAGHVDHGKSALVKALTGTDPDRLPEEKARGITIDLGFSELNLTAPNGDKIHAGIVDVPGHEDFVRNMIAGVRSIDLALLVVAADDSWMPQTEEHLQILTYLGVQRTVVALTKSDLGNIDRVTAEIRTRLRESRFRDAQIVPTSIRTSDGIENLKGALTEELATMQSQRDYGKPRLFIDRVFTLRGIGTVVTGTLTGGGLYRDQTIVIQPGNREARIRSIQSHGVELEMAGPGMRTAINLPDISVDQIKRGDVVTIVDLGQPNSTLLVRLEKSPTPSPGRLLKNGSSVYLHHGTSRVAAKIASVEKDGSARLKLASPVFAFLGDRFVVRDASEQHTIAGGIILDPDGERNRKSSPVPENVDLSVHATIASSEFVRTSALLRKSHFSAEEIGDALRRLESANEIVVREEIAADGEAWNKLRQNATDLIDNAHKEHSERAGLDLNELRAALPGREDIFDALIADLSIHGFVLQGSTIARTEHRPALPAQLRPVEMRIREALSQKPFDPPARKEIELDPPGRQALRFLIERAEVIEIGSDLVLLRDNYKRMKSRIRDFILKNGPSTVSELRQALESSRRVIVPFLERLDREGITQRMGDTRGLR